MSHDHLTTEKDPAIEGQPSVTPGDDDPARTVLWTAATARPLDDVAALIALFRESGDLPNPADETLRAAAVSRPLDEVRQLIALLNEPPHNGEDAHSTLRAAAMGRSVEDVAHLVSILAAAEREPQDGPTRTSLMSRAFRTSRTETAERTEAVERTEAPVRAEDLLRAEVPADAGDFDLDRELAEATASSQAQAQTQTQAQHAQAPVSAAAPAADPYRTDVADPLMVPDSLPAPEPLRDPRYDEDLARRAATYREPVPAQAPAKAARARTASPSLRSALRWPTGVALLAIGAIHLPTGFSDLKSGAYADAGSVLIAVLCLTMAVLLMVQDTAWTWGSTAAVAVAIVAAHALTASLTDVDLLKDSLGHAAPWAALAVTCAVLVALLSGSALLRGPRAVPAPAEEIRRPEPVRS
jgi:hypothetical protein